MSETLQAARNPEAFRGDTTVKTAEEHWDEIADAYEAQWKRPEPLQMRPMPEITQADLDDEPLLEAGEPEPLLEAVNPVEMPSVQVPSGLELAAAVARAKGLHAKDIHEEDRSPDTAATNTAAEVLSVYGQEKNGYERTHGIAGKADRYHEPEVPQPEAGPRHVERTDDSETRSFNELVDMTLEYATALLESKQAGPTDYKALQEQGAKFFNLYRQSKETGRYDESLRNIREFVERAASPKEYSDTVNDMIGRDEQAHKAKAVAEKSRAEWSDDPLQIGTIFIGKPAGREGGLWKTVEKRTEDGTEAAYRIVSVNDPEDGVWIDESKLAKLGGASAGEKVVGAVADTAGKVGDSIHEAAATVIDIADETLQNINKRLARVREAGKDLLRPEKWKNRLWKNVVTDAWLGGSVRVSNALAKWSEADDLRIYEKVGFDKEKFETYKSRRLKFMLGGAVGMLVLPEAMNLTMGALDVMSQHAGTMAAGHPHGLENVLSHSGATPSEDLNKEINMPGVHIGGISEASSPDATTSHNAATQAAEAAGSHGEQNAEALAHAHNIIVKDNDGGDVVIDRINAAMGTHLHYEDWQHIAPQLSPGTVYEKSAEGGTTFYGFNHEGPLSDPNKTEFVRYAQTHGRM